VEEKAENEKREKKKNVNKMGMGGQEVKKGEENKKTNEVSVFHVVSVGSTPTVQTTVTQQKLPLP
jgi:hypothetical protein